MQTLGLLHLPYSNKPLTLYQRTRNLLFLLWTQIERKYQTAIDSINQQLLFWTLQTVIYDKFSSSLSLSFFCLKMSKNALWWQDGKMASEISNFLARTQEIFFGKSFFPAYARGICKKRHFKLHPTPSFRHLIAQHPLTPIDTYRSSDRKRATVALLSFHCFAWLSLLCLFLVSLNCRRLLSRRFKLQLYFTLLSDRF